MFEATLHAADPDRQRQQRLILAAAIAVSTSSVAFASVWTLERLGIDRVLGPSQQFELLQFSLLPAPQIEPPPPPPPETSARGSASASMSVEETLEEDPTANEGLTQPQQHKNPIGDGKGMPTGTGTGCKGPLCTGALNPNVIGQTCTGPACATVTKLPPAIESAPAEVDFSVLRCLACANPDQAALRKTVATMRKRSGKVEVKFCVDRTGRVEANSIKVSRSFGVATVDQVTTKAIKGWRFSPMKVNGKPRRACSRTVFNIRFD